jgi:hypothetical protein
MVAAAVLACAPAFAQTVSSSLRGRVLDGAARPVGDAVITARHEETSAVRRVLSGPDGAFALNVLRPGLYTVQVEAPGFLSAVREGVTLPLQGTVMIDFTLFPALVEEVTVEAERPLLDPTTTAGGLSIGAREMAELPMSGRQFTDLALLDASILPVAPGTFYGEQAAVFSANGQGGRSNSFLVDGLDNNDATLGSRTRASFSQQVIQEFRVMTDGYAPEFGRASGGVLNIITRSGGNDPGGGVFFQGSDVRWNETGDFVRDLPSRPDAAESLRRAQFGGHLSGPIKRDRAFYFLAYEEDRSDDVVPFIGTWLDRAAGGRETEGGRFLAPNRGKTAFAKFDVVLGANHRLDARVSWDEAEVHGVNVGGFTTPEGGSRIDEDTVQLAASLTSAINSHWFHEVRLLAGSSDTLQQANSGLPGVDRPSGIWGGNHVQLQDRRERRLQLVDNVSWFRGRHAVKFGIDVERVSVDITAGFNDSGVFLYTSDAPYEPGDNGLGGIGAAGVDDDGDGVVDELPDEETWPLVYQLIQGRPSASFDTTLVALFIQDEFRVTPSFRLSYGLRYDLDTFGLDDRYAVKRVPRLPFPGAPTVPFREPNGGAGSDTDNIAPRLAFTWTPSRDTLFRGGLGIFYDKLVLGFPAISAITGEQELLVVPARALGFFITEDNIKDFDQAVLEQLKLLGFDLVLTTGDTLDTPYTVQANLGFEARVAKSTVFSANVVRARGHHLPLLRDLNPTVEFAFQGADKIPIHRSFTQNGGLIGSVASVETVGNSWYTALELGIARKEGPFRFRASYVLSESEDEGSDPLRGGIYLPFDSDNIEGERGRSDSDQRHRLVVSGTWNSPFWGLTVSPVVSYGSGIPFTVIVSDDLNGDGLFNDRPCTSHDAAMPCTGSNVKSRLRRNTGEETPLSLVNKLRRRENPLRRQQGLRPLAPIDDLEEPYFLQFDLRISKAFRMWGTRLDGYLQVFNLFNRVNGGPVNGRVSTETFGEPLGLLGPPRTVEAGLRLEF